MIQFLVLVKTANNKDLCRIKSLDITEHNEMKHIPSSLSEVKEDWLKSLLVDYGGFEEGSIDHIAKQTMGEGIGQVGQFLSLIHI